MRALLKNVTIMLCFLMLFAGCASVRMDLKTLETDKKLIGKLPLDSNAIVYIAVPYVDENKKVSKYEASKKILHSVSLKETSIDVAKKYFSNASNYSPEEKATFFVFLSGSFEIDRFIGALTANIHGKVYDASGNLLFEADTSGTETTGGPVNDASLYNALAEAQVDFYDQLMLSRMDIMQQLSKGNKSYVKQLISKLDKDEIRDIGSASAFAINESGAVLTNYHAVEKCLDTKFEYSGERKSSTVRYVDKEADLAVLETGLSFNQFAKFVSSSKPPRLGADIVVVGYPLQGVLSSKPSLSTGNISAMAGINDNENVYQITAPIQAGSSGGPVLDKSGLVIGIVQSKLNAVNVAKYTGDLPQNVNFAVKSDKIVEFLMANKVKFATTTKPNSLSTADIADLAKRYTLKVSCTGFVDLLHEKMVLSE
jgi:S1-C subfamily serine protease